MLVTRWTASTGVGFLHVDLDGPIGDTESRALASFPLAARWTDFDLPQWNGAGGHFLGEHISLSMSMTTTLV